MPHPEQTPKHAVVPVYIDRIHYDAPSHRMSGEAIRDLSKPPVPDDRDLWLEVEGPTDDQLIRPGNDYDVKTWAHYYTAPKTINPGSD
jgi:hypothetical protein